MTTQAKLFLRKRYWIWALFAVIFTLTAYRPILTVTPGLTQPEVIDKFLNGNLPNITPSNGGNVSWSVVPAFPNLTFNNPLVITMHPDPNVNVMFVASRQGYIEQFVPAPNVSTKNLFGDFTTETAVVHDGGFLGMAFHPEFGQTPGKNFVFLYYTAKGADGFGPFGCDAYCFSCESDARWYGSYLRLARYEVNESNGIYTVDKSSEVQMINILQWNATHRGGGLVFGDDGFLYLTIGDQARRTTAQDVIGNFEGGVIRIDVDKKGGSISHAPTKVINSTAMVNMYNYNNQAAAPVLRPTVQVTGVEYYIPNDNPKWYTNGTQYFEEFITVGHRAPHRMTKDRLTGDLWIGEVGDGSREEINQLQLSRILGFTNGGGNFGWPKKEGFLSNTTNACGSNNIVLSLGTVIDPVVDFFRSEANAIIGGYVYRGSKYSSVINGKYLCGDYSQNRIFLITPTYDNNGILTGGTKQEICTYTPGQLVTFGEDHAGEIYMGGLGTGKNLYTLQATGIGNPAPQFLSQTGAFQNLATMTPSEGVIPYDLVEPFWSDGAKKFRWLAVPSDNMGLHTNSSTQIQFSENGEWLFPRGSVLIKHFEMETSPGVFKKLETRFEVLGDDDIYYYLTYKWNSAGTDAELLSTSLTETIVVNGQTQDWYYPSRTDCQVCHQSSINNVLGPKTRNLNRDFTYSKTNITANQLVTLAHLGILNQTIMDEDVSNFLTLKAHGDVNASLEDRARSYIDVNCSYCHRPETGNRAAFDARYTTPLEQQNIINGAVISTLGITDARVVVPKSVGQSIMHFRANSLQSGVAMPPIAKNLVDQAGVQVIADWINSLEGTGSNLPLIVAGNATEQVGGCYQLTPAANTQLGAAWFPNQIDFDNDIEVSFSINMGSNDGGADGAALVFQTSGTTALGGGGGGLGAAGLTPSLGLEFDTYDNEGNDLANDHISLFKNGDFNQVLINPVCMDAGCGNIEDGGAHQVRFVWTSSTQDIEIYIDGSLRGQYQGDIVQDIFSGNSQVYVGVTASTGGANNEHTICNFSVSEIMPPPPIPSAGAGLTATYYDNADFTNPMVTRIDPTIDFNWGTGSPDPLIGAETYSARWEGEIQAGFSQTYTFYTNTDDGVRLWVNGQMVIDRWVDQPPTEASGTIALTAGERVPIVMEYYENGGGAVAQLSWSSAGVAKQIIPKANLYPKGAPIALFTLAPEMGYAPVMVDFNAAASFDPDGDQLAYEWDFGDGNMDQTSGVHATHTYTTPGVYAAKLTVSDGISGHIATKTVTINAIPECTIAQNLLNAAFAFNTEGFAYVDDAFRSTNQPSYATGQRITSGGYNNSAALQVVVGGVNNSSISNMSGGWQYSFTSSQSAELVVSFRYNLTQSATYETDEYSQALFSFDGNLVGQNGNDYLSQITGDGNSGSAISTGWLYFEVNLGTVAAGNHTIRVGGFNNKKTFNDETTTILIDDVKIDALMPNCAPMAALSVNTNSGEAPLPIVFDASSSHDPDMDPMTFTWDFGDGTSGNGEKVTHRYNFPGTYSVQLTVSDGSCEDYLNTIITVDQPSTDLGIFVKQEDIGNVAVAGSADHINGIYTLEGSGADIWGTDDAFQFLHRPHYGDGAIIAKVNSVTNTNAEAKAGIMFRSSKAANSQMVAVVQRPDKMVNFLWRSTNGGTAVSAGSWVGGTTAVKYLKLERTGNSFSAYYSTISYLGPWTQIGSSQTVSMPASTHVGLAVSSRDNGNLCTAIFDQVQINYASGSENIIVDAKVLLQGPWNGTDMNTQLMNAGMIPFTNPFNHAPWYYYGIENIAAVPADVIDWILVQVRDANDPMCIISERACFLKKDGTIIDLDGNSGVDFGVLNIKSAYISVKHRNHLGIMTNTFVNFE